jgi:hypothetical protein
MKFVIGTFFLILVLGIILALSLYFGGQALLKYAIIGYFNAKTGFDVALSEARLDLKNDTIIVEDFVVLNPRDFSERVFCDFDRLKIRFDYRRFFASTFPRDIIFPEIEFHARRFVIEKRKDGVTNLSLLKSLKPIKTKPKPLAGKKRTFLIERFVLSIQQVGYVDHTKAIGKYQVFNINVKDKVFENIDQPGLLTKIAVMEIIKGTTLDKIPLGIDQGKIGEDLSSLTGKGVTFGSTSLTKGIAVSEELFQSMSWHAAQPFVQVAGSAMQTLEGATTKSVAATGAFFETVGSEIAKGVNSLVGKKDNGAQIEQDNRTAQ